MQKINATLIKNQVTSNSSEAYSLLEKSSFGEKVREKVLYSLSEAFFLFEGGKMQIRDFKGKIIQREQLQKRFYRADKNFLVKYPVFKSLRESGYIVKTALKFGAEFRVYDKGSRRGSHSKWLCYPISENESIKWQDFAAKNRVAHATKKNLLIAIIDEENQISYYEIKWTKI